MSKFNKLSLKIIPHLEYNSNKLKVVKRKKPYWIYN